MVIFCSNNRKWIPRATSLWVASLFCGGEKPVISHKTRTHTLLWLIQARSFHSTTQSFIPSFIHSSNTYCLIFSTLVPAAETFLEPRRLWPGHMGFNQMIRWQSRFTLIRIKPPKLTSYNVCSPHGTKISSVWLYQGGCEAEFADRKWEMPT